MADILSGLLGDIDEPRKQGLLALALGMMEAGGSSPRPVTFGQGLARGGAAGLGAYNARKRAAEEEQQAAIRRRLLDMQTRKLEEDVRNEQQADQWISNPDNFFKTITQRSEAPIPEGMTGPGDLVETQAKAPLDRNELLMSMLRSNVKPLARDAAKSLLSQDKAQTHTLPPGSLMVDSNGRIVARNDQQPKTANEATSIREYEYALKNGYKGSYEQWMRDRHPPMPNFGFLQTDTGIRATNSRTGEVGPVVAQPPNRAKDIPFSVKNSVAMNEAYIKAIDDAIKEVEANPDSFGLLYSGPDIINQRLDPKGVTARGKVANIGSKKMHDRSGAAVTYKEMPRLEPFIPKSGDTPQKVIDNLNGLKRIAIEETEALVGKYQESDGYKPFKFNASPDKSDQLLKALSRIPIQAIQELKRNPTPQNKKYFDDAFGYQGLADEVLRK